jgi:hypothetical protein
MGLNILTIKINDSPHAVSLTYPPRTSPKDLTIITIDEIDGDYHTKTDNPESLPVVGRG